MIEDNTNNKLIAFCPTNRAEKLNILKKHITQRNVIKRIGYNLNKMKINLFKNIKPYIFIRKSKFYLWQKNQTLYWSFSNDFDTNYRLEFKTLFDAAINQWQQDGYPLPIGIIYTNDSSKANFLVEKNKNSYQGNRIGTVYASSFFPEEHRSNLIIYKEFENNSDRININILAHELGHIFGLCHIDDEDAQSVYDYSADTVMVVGYPVSRNDLIELKKMYSEAWKKGNVNGKKIILQYVT